MTIETISVLGSALATLVGAVWYIRGFLQKLSDSWHFRADELNRHLSRVDQDLRVFVAEQISNERHNADRVYARHADLLALTSKIDAIVLLLQSNSAQR
jgi:hypothetical protein